ncbi:hypothetical protein Dimus_023943 [Dionaea muscipula]
MHGVASEHDEQPGSGSRPTEGMRAAPSSRPAGTGLASSSSLTSSGLACGQHAPRAGSGALRPVASMGGQWHGAASVPPAASQRRARRRTFAGSSFNACGQQQQQRGWVMSLSRGQRPGKLLAAVLRVGYAPGLLGSLEFEGRRAAGFGRRPVTHQSSHAFYAPSSSISPDFQAGSLKL